MHDVHLIESASTLRKRYTGYTDDLKQRMRDQNSGKNVSTAGNRPWQLKTYLAFDTKMHALDFERCLKSGSGHAFAKKRLWSWPVNLSATFVFELRFQGQFFLAAAAARPEAWRVRYPVVRA